MTITSNQHEALHQAALADPYFRRLLLNNPGKAASRLGLTLADQDFGPLVRCAEGIKAAGETADARLNLAEMGLLPVGGGGKGRDESKNRKPKKQRPR